MHLGGVAGRKKASAQDSTGGAGNARTAQILAEDGQGTLSGSGSRVQPACSIQALLVRVQHAAPCAETLCEVPGSREP